jgi:hypothetical protein
MKRNKSALLSFTLIVILALLFLRTESASAVQLLGITPTATNTDVPDTATPTPTGTLIAVTDTPTPTEPSVITDTPTPTDPLVITDTPTPTGTLGITTPTFTPSPTITPTGTGTIIVEEPPNTKTPTSIPVLPSTGEFPFDPYVGLEWLFGFLLVVILGALMFRSIRRTKSD